jgi:hypothetical protein
MSRSKKRHDTRHLLNQLETRFKTIMIGSLSRVESHFGFLWGHESKDKLTPKQEQFLDIWEDLRNEILNHGNYHLREGLYELEEHLHESGNDKDNYSYRFNINDN